MVESANIIQQKWILCKSALPTAVHRLRWLLCTDGVEGGRALASVKNKKTPPSSSPWPKPWHSAAATQLIDSRMESYRMGFHEAYVLFASYDEFW